MTHTLPSVAELKAQAKRLRTQLSDLNTPVTHSGALEMLARQYGLHDWNTLHAKAASLPNHRPPWAVGDFVRGRYLNQPCAGRILALRALPDGSHRVTVHLEEAVDVVEFDSFSNMRQRITATLNSSGVSAARRSDGVPHLVLDA